MALSRKKFHWGKKILNFKLRTQHHILCPETITARRLAQKTVVFAAQAIEAHLGTATGEAIGKIVVAKFVPQRTVASESQIWAMVF